MALPLEVTDPGSVAAVVDRVQDVTVLVDNAGIALGTQFLISLLDSGGGHILDVHSVLSWLAEGGACSASKAAFWSQTNNLRLALGHRRGGPRRCRVGRLRGARRRHHPLGQGRPVGRARRHVRAARPVAGPGVRPAVVPVTCRGAAPAEKSSSEGLSPSCLTT